MYKLCWLYLARAPLALCLTNDVSVGRCGLWPFCLIILTGIRKYLSEDAVIKMEEKLLQDPQTPSEIDGGHSSCSRRDVILDVSEYRHLAGQDASVNLNGGHNCNYNSSPNVESHHDKVIEN